LELFAFTLIFESEVAELTEDMLEAFYDAGAADATIGRSSGVFFAGFSPAAEDLLEAVISAIQTIEGAGVGATVVRVEPDDLVTIADIARRMGRTNESIRLLIHGERGPGGFPAPSTRIGSGRSRVWRWADVAEWFGRYEKHPDLPGVTCCWLIISLVNDFLRQRAFLSRTDPVSLRVRQTLERTLGRDRKELVGADSPV
jgi:hypothetical protein